MRRTIYYDRHLTLFPELKKHKTLGAYIFLCTVKERFLHQGSFTLKELYSVGYSRSSVSKYIKTLNELEWIRDVSATKYVLLSYNKIAASYGVKIGKSKKAVHGDNVSEVKARAAFLFIKLNQQKQAEKEYPDVKKQIRTKAICRANNGTTFSTRRVMRLLGMFSPTSGTNCFRKMESLGLLKRVRRSKYLGQIEDIGILAVNKENKWYVDWRNNAVYERLTSEIILIA